MDDDQPVVALDTGMDRVIEAEFVWRPGVGALDLVSDLAAFLAEGGIFATVETFDRNEIDYDANLDPVFVGNGILDAAELALVEAVLKNAATDFSARGGITGDGVWAAWQTNLAQAQLDMASRSASVQRVVAAYMTLGDYKSVESIKDLALAKFGVTLEDTLYDRSRQRFFYWKHDPDADGLDMLDEWTLAAAPGQAPTLGDLPTFLAQSLNGVANGQASAGGAPPDCSNLTCPAMATVTQGTPSGGTLTVEPLGLLPYGTEIKVTATPDPSYTFLGYSTTPATLVSGSWEESPSFPLTGPYAITPPYAYPVINVSGTFWRSHLEIPLNPTSYSISVEGDNLEEVVDGNVRKFYGPPYTKLKVTLSNKSDSIKVAGAEIDACVGCAAPGYALQTSFPVELPAFGAISVEPWFGGALPETVTFSLASNEGGVVVGAQGAGGGVEFTRRLTAAKDSPVLFGARPYPGYRFVAWSSFADSHTGGTVRAEFEEIPGYRLTVETSGDAPCSGYVSIEGQSFLGLPDGENNAKGIYYYQNGVPDKVALEAHASPGYCFKMWTGQIPDGADPTFPSLPLTMDKDKSVTAVFEAVGVRAFNYAPSNLETSVLDEAGSWTINYTWNPECGSEAAFHDQKIIEVLAYDLSTDFNTDVIPFLESGAEQTETMPLPPPWDAVYGPVPRIKKVPPGTPARILEGDDTHSQGGFPSDVGTFCTSVKQWYVADRSPCGWYLVGGPFTVTRCFTINGDGTWHYCITKHNATKCKDFPNP